MTETMRATPVGQRRGAFREPGKGFWMTNLDITGSEIAQKSKKKSRTQALSESLLRDRAERAARKAVRSITKIERGDFDAFEATRWRVIAGRNPGYLVATPMRRRSVGWFVACDHCG